MPSKKKKYNARFPAGRIKKIMQSDEEIGKVAQAVPVIIYIPRTLELFVESLLTKTLRITNSRNAKTLSPSHMKQCIMAENRFDFLRELVRNIPDISVAEEVNNDSSPEATIDQSDTPYDLSMPSTSNCNDVPTPKAMPSNGSISLIRNGVTRSCGTTVSASILQSPTLKAGAYEESRAQLKRQWDVIGRLHQVQTATEALASNSNIHPSTDSTPPKLIRTDSAPAALKAQQSPQTIVTPPNPQHHHQQEPNQLLPTDLRRLRHQPKSVPGNICVSNATSQRNNNKQQQTPATAIPAPIVSIDFCNKPIVKIDYSNLALHDTSYSESPSSSSSSPTVEHLNRSVAYVAKNPLQQIPVTNESPVINIDLSNIVTTEAFPAQTLHANCGNAPIPSTVTANKNSFLELDEDYDNI